MFQRLYIRITSVKILFALNGLFWMWWMFALWDWYQTILAAGDNPYRWHHGWLGMTLIAVVWMLWMSLYLKNKRSRW